jgi:hypothetical protein
VAELGRELRISNSELHVLYRGLLLIIVLEESVCDLDFEQLF